MGKPDVMFLTVGTNPLPVKAAFEALCKVWQGQPDHVYLVSSGTPSIRKNAERLQQKGNIVAKITYIDDPSDPRKIKEGIVNLLRQHDDGLKETANVTHLHCHLHYTGGTKAMSVHAFEAMKEWASSEVNEGKARQASASYLDHRTHKIIDNNGNTLVEDARYCYQPELKEVADLHGFEFVQAPDDNPPQNAAIELGRALIRDRSYPELWNKFRDWVTSNIEGKKIKKEAKWTSNEEPFAALLAGLKERLENELGAITDGEVRVKVGKFITGGWLELYVFSQLKTALDSIRREGFKIYHSVSTKADTWDKDFELDVVALLGYQLVVVSCKTGKSIDEKAVKMAGFEVRVRSQQLGGEAAQGLVVCFRPKEEGSTVTVQTELQQDMGTDQPPVQVWGFSELSHLRKTFEDYLRDSLEWQ